MEETLQTKLVQLSITSTRTNKILDAGKYEAIERHGVALKATISEVDHCKRAVEAQKIAAKQDLSEIGDWVAEIDGKLAEADLEVNRLREWQNEFKKHHERKAQEKELKFEQELHETRMKFQSELQAAKVTMSPGDESHINDGKATQEIHAKLPKLEITKFDGSYQDWPRFWGQYSETIDKTGVANVTKFAYLRELLCDSVCKTVEALPFTTEGYNRAKSILKEKYGKDSEIIKAYTKQIFDLPTIPNVNVKRVHEFSEKLSYAVQSLETMGSLDKISGNVAMTLDKLSGIRGDLVRTDPEWESWDFAKLTQALTLWTRRNPIDKAVDNQSSRRRDNQNRLFNARVRGCVYCEDTSHKANDCTKVTSKSDRKQILSKRRLCFNCATGNHRAAECSSKATCQHCDKRHHTSICDREFGNDQVKKEKIFAASKNDEGIFPVVTVRVGGVVCRALIDSGAGSSYVSSKFIHHLKAKPVEVEMKQIDMLMCNKQARLETYQLKVESIDHQYEMEVRMMKVDKAQLLTVDNPHYEELIRDHAHLKGITVNDYDKKSKLPVHIVLGSGEYARIKTKSLPRIGKEHEPVAELTKLGWFLMSPGQEFDQNVMLVTQTSQSDYEQLCRLDVLGLEDTPENNQENVYSEFKEQLVRDRQGWYETGLTWKGNHPQLPTNKKGSLRRLDNLVRKLERTDSYNDYDQVITDQLREGIIEPALGEPVNKEFYIPHKAVIKENASSTTLRVVYDASARAQPTAPSLNECLNPGPPLQNMLWNVLVHQRSYPVAVCGDIQKAFLQVRIKECERDALRFHWKHPGQDEVQVYRFTRALFGLTCSPFLLGGVIDQHLELWKSRQPEIVAELQKNLYVDDLLTGGSTIEEARAKKSSMVKILNDAGFKLHKWNANASELEEDGDNPKINDEQTFAKQQLGVLRSESKVLGLQWNKSADTLTIPFSKDSSSTTKRGILSKLAKVYDPLGLASPITLLGKMIYRDVCDEKTAWDAQLSHNQAQRWKRWEESLPEGESVPRPIATHREPIQSVVLHAFGDASNHGVSAAVYAVVEQPSGTTQTLVAAKSRLAKRGLTIPRLELVGAHMAVNLITNVHQALDGLPVVAQHCWLDSTVVLYWIQGRGKYKQFVANRVSKIQKHPNISWQHVPTKENPADLGSRGSSQLDDLWRGGPVWLAEPESWPEDPILKSTTESQAEEKVEREIFACAVQATKEANVFDVLLNTHINNIWRTLRICAWVDRFLRNSKVANRVTGPLTTTEIQKQLTWWIQRTQQNPTNPDQFQKDCIQLNVQKNEEGILECRGRIVGQYPVYLPDTAPFTEGLVCQAHIDSLHGGVTLTMARLRERYWIPRLRKLVKQVRRRCCGCKRFQAIAYTSPPPGQLPITRTEGETPYQVVGVDFAGPIKCIVKAKTEGKSYLALYACSLTRGVYLELLHTLETAEFLRCLKRFVARRGRPKVIYSDNGSTFKGAAEWIKKVNNDERFHDYLAKNSIEWKFNLSRAPWWGGQFERLVGIFKAAFYKTIGNGTLTFDELSEVVIDVETAINSRPLDYVEDDIQLPVLTPNSLLFLQPNQIPELEAHRIQEPGPRRRARHLSRTKEAMWSRWSSEYVRSLRERHRLQGEKKVKAPAIGEMVIIKGDEKNRNLWKLGKIVELIYGRDEIVRGAKVQTGKGILERSTQHLYPLELSCDTPMKKDQLNPEAPMFRPKRPAAEAAREKIKAIAVNEQAFD